jgi:type VI secretion system protein
MTLGATLFERLLLAGASSRSTGTDHRAAMASVLANLRDILGSRQGSSAAQPDLGLPPPNELRQNYPASIADLQRAIAATITRYEPRLRDVKVTYIQVEDEPLTVHFQVAAALVVDGQRQLVAFETCVDHSGKVKVDG